MYHASSRVLKDLRKAIFIVFFFSCYESIFAITIPEGIRGFTVTYGTWIESVLSNSILKNILFPEDKEQYDKFERLIITSERLSEEGNSKDALSYLRRADFYLQDLGKSYSRKFGWNKSSYTVEETKNWTSDVREAWTIYQFHQIHLFLQYEYYNVLNYTPSAEHYIYLQNALN